MFASKKLRYKTRDIVTTNKDLSFSNGVTIPAGTEVEITFTDRFLGCYDIFYRERVYTEIRDDDFK